jgi:hypothetical protein
MDRLPINGFYEQSYAIDDAGNRYSLDIRSVSDIVGYSVG